MPSFFRALLICQVALFCGLQYNLWIGDWSIPQVLRAQDRLVDYEENNAALEQRNRSLYKSISALHSGGAALEERARLDLGMIRPEESFFVLIPSD